MAKVLATLINIQIIQHYKTRKKTQGRQQDF